MTQRDAEDITYEYDENAPIYLPTANAANPASPGAGTVDARERKAPKSKKSNRRKQQNGQVFGPSGTVKMTKTGKSMLNDTMYRPGKRSIYARIRESE